MVRFCKRLALLPAVLLSPIAALSPAHADTYSGQITGLQANDTGSMDFRVILNTSMTNCSLNFAFVDHTSALFQTYVAGFYTAYSSGKPVTVQVNREASGYCRIYFAQF